MLALVKPAGLASVPDASGDESALDLAKQYVKQTYGKPGAVFLGVVHRLDRPVGGVLAFARTSKSAARLSEQFRTGRARKTYLALGEGLPRASDATSPSADASGRSGVLEQWLLKDESRNVVEECAAHAPGAKLARTAWRVLSTRGGRTLYEFRPETGRPHQLRLAARALGTPLVGDVKYGARTRLDDGNVALFAVKLELEHPTTKDALVLEAPAKSLPDWAARR